MYYNKLPYGEGLRFEGRYIHDKTYDLYFQMFKCQFDLKEGYIPTIQLKHTRGYQDNEYVTTSNGEFQVLYLTSVDLELFFEHYDVYNVEWLGGWKFRSRVGMFKEYIDKWMKVKIEASKSKNKGMRTLAKLMLNALYGKFGLNPKVRGKYPVFEDGKVKYRKEDETIRNPIYIPLASFVTSWARYKTISSAQKVYDRFCYADTDSLHLTGKDIPLDLEIDDNALGAWKIESEFTRARFVRQKTYIEEIEGKLHVTCCGMPARIHSKVTWDNFHIGSEYEGKLMPKHVEGGIVLQETTFKLH